MYLTTFADALPTLTTIYNVDLTTTPEETYIITQCDDAILLAGRGIPVFPALNKKPLVKWKDEATVAPELIRKWWKRWPDAQIGVPMPLGTVAIDIDDLEAVKQADLEWKMTQRQQTPSGGWHMFYTTDGRPVPQTVKRGGIALDTRVGGLGYVIAYDVDAFLPPVWAEAPGWVYEEERTRAIDASPTAPMGTRDDIIEWLGGIANREPSFGARDFLSLLTAAQDEGRIIDLVKNRPWTIKDLRALAIEAAKWAGQEPDWWADSGITHDNAQAAQKRVETFFTAAVNIPQTVNIATPQPRQFMDAADLLTKDITPARDAVKGLLPEGLGVLAAPPKAGKSLLAYQLAVELTLGQPILGKEVEQRPVLYYALEDGERRSQDRIIKALGTRKLPRGLMLRWDAPPLGGPLEQEVSAYLDQNPLGVVIIDVLAAVRPQAGRRNLNAYDEDYNVLTPMRDISHRYPGSVVLFVTHDRKAGADDWMTRITGTRGVSGVADFCVFIHRERGKTVGVINVTGRDVEDGTIGVNFTGSGWEVADANAWMGEASQTRNRIYQYVKSHGPIYQKAVAEGLGDVTEGAVTQQFILMERDGQIAGVIGGYVALDVDPATGQFR